MSKPEVFYLFLDQAVEYKHFGPQRVEELGDRQICLIEKSAYDKAIEALKDISYMNEIFDAENKSIDTLLELGELDG